MGNFSNNFMKYRQLQIITVVTNQVMFTVFPAAMLVTLICCVSMGYLIIKLTGAVPMPLTMLAVSFLILFSVIIHVLMPLLIEVATLSFDFVTFWHLQNPSGNRRRQLKSCRLIRLSVGSFLYMSKGFRAELFSLAIYYTISLVILV